MYVEKNYNNHFSTTKRHMRPGLIVCALEGEQDHTNAFLNCKEKTRFNVDKSSIK